MPEVRKYWHLCLPPVFLLAVGIFHKPLSPIAKAIGDLYDCPFRKITGIHCPGCGGTRAMLELLHGHPLRAVHDNPAAPLLVVLLLLWYGEHILAAFGKNVRLFPRGMWFWGILIVLYLVWAVVRLFVPELLPLPLS